jgi:hypothetical protein
MIHCRTHAGLRPTLPVPSIIDRVDSVDTLETIRMASLVRRVPAAPVRGTWDFKWPAGKTIRVYFQELPPDSPESDREAFGDITRLIEEVARRWTETGANIFLRFEHDDLLPPPARRQPGEAVASQSRVIDTPYAYDVLVSLAPLPMTETFIERLEVKRTVRIEAPVSQLGTYASRRPWGVPTLYLGAPTSFTSLTQYVESDQARFTYVVLHEFGHALGLAHEHQNPRIATKIPWKRSWEIKDILEPFLFTAPSLTFIKEEITSLWPGEIVGDPVNAYDRGPVAFSDWVAPDKDPSDGDFASVMAYPFLKYLVQSSTGGSSVDYAYWNGPTDRDVAHLRLLYPPEYETVPTKDQPPAAATVGGATALAAPASASASAVRAAGRSANGSSAESKVAPVERES